MHVVVIFVVKKDALKLLMEFLGMKAHVLGQKISNMLAIPYKSNAGMVREATVSGTKFWFSAISN